MLFPVLLAASMVVGQNPDECRHEDNRVTQLTGANALEVEAGSGTLRVEGRAGATGVRIESHLCASSEELLEDMHLETGVSGGSAHIRTDLPNNLRNREYARMNLVIIVPAGMAAEIDDGSGETWISGLGNAEINDGSGELTIERITGSLRVVDGSGELTINDVAGSLNLEDGSGEMNVRGVRGIVRIEDGSGSILVADSGSDVEIDDGSGSIRVDGVAGSFIVDSDGSGGIRHSNVRGEVRIPR